MCCYRCAQCAVLQVCSVCCVTGVLSVLLQVCSVCCVTGVLSVLCYRCAQCAVLQVCSVCCYRCAQCAVLQVCSVCCVTGVLSLLLQVCSVCCYRCAQCAVTGVLCYRCKPGACVCTTQQVCTVRSVPRSSTIGPGALPMAAVGSRMPARVSMHPAGPTVQAEKRGTAGPCLILLDKKTNFSHFEIGNCASQVTARPPPPT